MNAAPEAHGVRRVARLSARALDHTLSLLIDLAGRDARVDLRADAYGHGAAEVESRARARGITHFVTDDGDVSIADAEDGPEMLAYGFGADQHPVMRLEGEVVAVKRVAHDTAVSYGYQYRTTGESTLALVGLGYADGVPRLASSRATVAVGNVRGIVAGRIAMDQFVVDLRGSSATAGEPAVLWHDAETLAEWCTATERSAATLTTRLGPRIHRVWDES